MFMTDVSSRTGVPREGKGGVAAGRPLRRDAEANRRRILAAAGRVFAERGLEVTMDDIAAAAGVGVGTVYRRFPDKQELIDALLGQRVELVAQAAEEALQMDGPWEAVVTFLREATAMQVTDRALAELLRGQPGGRVQVEQARARIDPLVQRLVTRAQDSGELRPDVTGPDLAVAGMMIALIADRFGPAGLELWPRYFDLILDGLRTSRVAPTPLAAGPIPVDVFHQVMFPPA
jgi:AcrR family transcriptional regulator